MTAHADILDQRDSLRGAFWMAAALHAAVFGWMAFDGLFGNHDRFGAVDAGGSAIGIEAVKSIPLPHRGMENPLANDTESQVPQTPVRAREQTQKRPKESPDAVALKDRSKKKLSQVAAEKNKFRPFEELDPNRLTAKQAPQVSSQQFSALPGAGRVGTGANTTLGTIFPGYAEQIQRLIAQKWRTGDVDARIQTGPVVIATFDLLRNGQVKNLQLLQASGISSLDLSVQRAILEASPFPPIPSGFNRDSAKVEFWFELKR
jgi:protein TonB